MGFFTFLAVCIAAGCAMHGYEIWIKHRETMAMLRMGERAAKALMEAPDHERSALARELLEAYDEAGQGLENDV